MCLGSNNEKFFDNHRAFGGNFPVFCRPGCFFRLVYPADRFNNGSNNRFKNNILKYMNIFSNKKKGFTLIELLTVISIIALSTTLVLMNLNSGREKARISKSLEASQTINNTIGAYAVGVWRFNEGTGNTVTDSSNYGNNGTWNGSGNHWTTTTVSQLGMAGQFNGTDDYVNMGNPNNGSLSFGTGDFTLSAWFYLNSLPGTWKSIIEKGGSGSAGYGMEISADNKITCSIQGSGGTNQHVSGSVPKSGVWHYAACVFDRDNKIFVYLDGKENTSAAYGSGNTNSVDNSVQFRIGEHTGWNFNGLIDEVRVFTQALAVKEVEKNYADALIKYDNFVKK